MVKKATIFLKVKYWDPIPSSASTEISQILNVIDEIALITALDSGKVAFAGLDVFDNEPTPAAALLAHPKISLTPHIGASTNEAQERIGTELANLIIDHFRKV